MIKKIQKTGLRGVRKASHISYRLLKKGTNFSAKVEDKTTRIITGKDSNIQLEKEISIEEALYRGIDYNISPLNPAMPAIGRKGKITILIPSLNKQSFFGGTATALIFAGKLAEKQNMGLRIIETLAPGGKDGLGDFMKKNKINMNEKIEIIDVSARTHNRYGYIDLHEDDICIASAWWDAMLLSRLPLKKKFIYLIQDYEPIFYANSDEYVLAENTYRTNNFIPVCNTELMYKFMCSKGYDYIKKNGVWFEPAVSRIGNKPRPTTSSGKKQIFLYGRPMVARNLYYTALMALNSVFDSGELDSNGWEIIMAGQDKVPSITLSSGVKIRNLGKMSMDSYIEMMSGVDIAISPMMAPHPNYPTLEFASVGAAVVTTSYETKQDLSNYSKNIIVAGLSVDEIANAVIQASKMSVKERMNNMSRDNIESSWDKSLVNVLDHISKKVSI